ncbi:MAG: hypothetical protein IAI49_10905 [Candidatus Eremiobacteraeota bacterium]|nr:hypothetical protein [Candidatus Eremiobacteraeota bacterium]
MSNIAQKSFENSLSARVGVLPDIWVSTWYAVAASTQSDDMLWFTVWASIRNVSIRELGRRLGNKHPNDVKKYFSAKKPRQDTIAAIRRALNAPPKPFDMTPEVIKAYAVYDRMSYVDGLAVAGTALFDLACGTAYGRYQEDLEAGIATPKPPGFRPATEEQLRQISEKLHDAFLTIYNVYFG